MNEERKIELEPQKYDQFEDEIELMDYLKVLWKWKYLILIGTLICVIGAAVVSLNMTKIYGITTVLQPGILKVTDDGKMVYIDSPQNIKAVIETGGINGQVLKGIKFSDQKEPPTSVGFKVTMLKGTNVLEVLYETPYVDIGLEIMKNLNDGLLERYAKIIKRYQENYENKIRTKSSEAFKLNEKVVKVKHAISTAEAENDVAVSEILTQISGKRAKISTVEVEKNSTIMQQSNKNVTIGARIQAKQKQIINLQQRISDVMLEIDRVSKNTDLLIEERTKFLASAGKQDNVLASVIYTNTIQQNISYLNDLRSTINNVNHQIFQEKTGIVTLENQGRDVEIQKESLEKQTQYKVANFQSDIKDLQAQKESLTKQTQYKAETMKSEIKDLENERKSMLEEIKGLELKKNSIQNIQIVKRPKSSPSPIKPKTRLNVMLAGVVGLFLTVFLAFFVEYISKYNSREDEP